MLLLFAALAATTQSPPKAASLGQTAWIFTTIGLSEWCNPGHVRLDLRTGRYSLTARAPRLVCNDRGLERPIRSGTLRDETLGKLRAAYQLVLREGLENPVCRSGGKPQDMVISNAGTPILLLATGRAVGSAPDDLSCWSKSATALHRALDDAFGVRNWR